MTRGRRTRIRHAVAVAMGIATFTAIFFYAGNSLWLAAQAGIGIALVIYLFAHFRDARSAVEVFDAIRCRRVPRGKHSGPVAAAIPREPPEAGEPFKDGTQGAAEKPGHPSARVWNGWQPFGVYPRNLDE